MNFDFLKNLTHSHPKKSTDSEPVGIISAQVSNEKSHQNAFEVEPIIMEEPESQNEKETINSRTFKSIKSIRQDKKQVQSVVALMQKGESARLDQHTLDVMKGLLKNSEKQPLVNALVIQNAKKLQANKEKKVYVREMSKDEGEYLAEVHSQTKIGSYFLRIEISNTVQQIINSITADILADNSDYQVQKKKFVQKNNIDKIRLIKLRQSELSSKIGELSIDMQLSDANLTAKANSIVNKNQVDVEAFKNKIAENFIRSKQQERSELQQKNLLALEKKQQIQQIHELRKQEDKKMHQQQKHLQLLEKIQQKQAIKLQQQEKAEMEKAEYLQFLKKYSNAKPLFVKKEEQFQEQINQEKKQRLKILEKKQSLFEPLDFQNLENHEQKYMELKKEDRQRKEAEIELANQEEKLRKQQMNEKIFKGKFRFLALQEMIVAQTEKEAKVRQKEEILAKKVAYSMEVKERYRPTIDIAKREELENLMKSNKNQKRKYRTPNRVAYSEHFSTISNHNQAYSEADMQADPQKEGKKYFRQFKQYIRDKIDRGEVKSTVETSRTLEPKPNYLKQMREKTSPVAQSIRVNKEIASMEAGTDMTVLMLKAEQFDQKAKRREKKLRNSEHSPHQEAQLEDEYLFAIKAKLSLLKNAQ